MLKKEKAWDWYAFRKYHVDSRCKRCIEIARNIMRRLDEEVNLDLSKPGTAENLMDYFITDKNDCVEDMILVFHSRGEEFYANMNPGRKITRQLISDAEESILATE